MWIRLGQGTLNRSLSYSKLYILVVVIKPTLLGVSVLSIPRLIPIEFVIKVPLGWCSALIEWYVAAKASRKYLELSVNETFTDPTQE